MRIIFCWEWVSMIFCWEWVSIIFLNIRRRPSLELPPSREQTLFVWPWFCAWLIPHSSQSLHALNKTGVVQLIVGNHASRVNKRRTSLVRFGRLDCADFILVFSANKKVTNAKVLDFFPVTSGDKSTWRPLERRHKRLYACFRSSTLPNCRRAVSLPMSRISRFNCLGWPFQKMSLFEQYPGKAKLDEA